MGLKMDTESHPFVWMLLVAMAAGLGQLLASAEKLTWRIVIGRALSSGALGVAAGSMLIWYPDMDIRAMVGGAAVLASLGTSGLERILQKILGKG